MHIRSVLVLAQLGLNICDNRQAEILFDTSNCRGLIPPPVSMSAPTKRPSTICCGAEVRTGPAGEPE